MDATREKMEKLGALASATTGASFHVSKKQNGKWVIHFYNSGTKFENKDYDLILDAAIEWLTDARRPKDEIQKYTIR